MSLPIPLANCLLIAFCLANLTASVVALEQPAIFYRAVNLNGPSLLIDGQQWEAGSTSDLECDAKAFENQQVILKPATDSNRAQMIRSSRWGQSIAARLADVPNGPYQVFAYVWEDNASERFSLQLNSKTVVAQYDSGGAGKWKRLGPWRTLVSDGTMTLSARGGAANLSGIEIWSGFGPVPDPVASQFATNPTAEQLSFFESKIRPLLIEHCYECHSKDADEPLPSNSLEIRRRTAWLVS